MVRISNPTFTSNPVDSQNDSDVVLAFQNNIVSGTVSGALTPFRAT